MTQRRIYSLTAGFTLFGFAVLAVVWFYLCNRFFVLYYHEQIQLFRFDGMYFRTYLDRPGGLAGYMGSFLTQFYVYPVAGALLIAGVLSAAVLLFYAVCRSCGNMGQMFFIPFVPAVLLMMSFGNIHFDMSAAVGLLLMLIAFRGYLSLPLPIRYGAGVALFAVLYFVVGGNALLLTVMVIIHELTQKKKDRQQNRQGIFLYLLLLSFWSALLPCLAWRLIYTVSAVEAFFALTPANFLFPTLTHQALWLSLPVLYLVWRLIASRTEQWCFSTWKGIVFNCFAVLLITVSGAYLANDSKAETLNRMVFDVQRGNWESVMSLGRTYPGSNRLACYLTNIALAETGQMPYNMFRYRQVGVAGLFLDWQLNYFSLWYSGEVYYRLGIIAEAEHCAFEALVSSPKEPNAATLRRLVVTNIVRRDPATVDKYLRYFDRSLAYRKWAKQQRTYLAMAMADTTFHHPDAPASYRGSDFFITCQQPDYSLLMLLESNPKHRLAFEYLMAYYMLQKDIEMVKWCMDSFFGNFDYQGIPAHYEEALMVYQNAVQASDELFTQYPVSQTTRDRFDRYAQAFKVAQGNKRNFEQLKKQFGNTYWYYVHFVEPSNLKKKDEQNRY